MKTKQYIHIVALTEYALITAEAQYALVKQYDSEDKKKLAGALKELRKRKSQAKKAKKDLEDHIKKTAKKN